ncbi:glycosyltransferase family 2 protein [Actinoplanes sp. NPDC051513]|uniref:glycosyltransferase family 2 protein n=1 Tax=Actinoplanes sp. NPDC051513 TaxID=3363908 RepID=UPI0037A30815
MVTRVAPQPLRTRPRVSVMIPCYNYGHYLPGCVDSVLSQQDVDVDVLIVDDASPDGSAEVARKLADADPRVRLIAHETNKRHIATYNEGLAAVDGDYVVLLSADDLLSAGSLARSVALMEAHPEVAMVYGFSPTFADEPPAPRTTVSSWSIWEGPEWIEQMCRRMSNPVSTPEVVMRGSVMRELVGYDARLPHAADFLLWLRAGTRGAIGRINGADQAYYRKHGANMHVQMFAGVHTDIVQRKLTFEILFSEDEAFLPAGHGLLDVAMRSLAREALVTAAQPGPDSEDEPRDRLVALAAELCPPDRDPALWQDYERLRARGRGGNTVISRTVEDITGRLRWRQWRRTGLMSPVGSIGAGR